MKRLCLDCGLLFDMESNKRLFKTKSDIDIPCCEYCRGKKNIDITDAEELAPLIMRLTEIGLKVIHHSLIKDMDGGHFRFSLGIFEPTQCSYNDIEEVFNRYGNSLKFCYFHPLDDERRDVYVIGASFDFDGGFTGHIGSKYNKNMVFTSYEYLTKYSDMIHEFDSVIERMINI